jgi:hypothetical protein
MQTYQSHKSTFPNINRKVSICLLLTLCIYFYEKPYRYVKYHESNAPPFARRFKNTVEPRLSNDSRHDQIGSVPKQANWQPGTWDVRRESISYVAASAQCSLLLEFAGPFFGFLRVCCFLEIIIK